MNRKLDETNERFIFCTQAKSGYENPLNPYDIVYTSAQITLARQLSLSEQAPPCEKIMSKAISLRIEHAKTIDSVEIIDGIPVKGKKLIVNGMIHIKLEYISCHDPSQRIFFQDWKLPFSSVLLESSCDTQSMFPCDFELSNYMVYACTEYFKISCKATDCLDATIALRIWLQELNSRPSSMDERKYSEMEKEDWG
jgi:hypothetical protein